MSDTEKTKYSREYIETQINTRGANSFESWISDLSYREGSPVTEVFYQSYGDGNELQKVFHFAEADVYVLLVGTYSSWDSSDYDTVTIAEPYTFTETRYKPVED